MCEQTPEEGVGVDKNLGLEQFGGDVIDASTRQRGRPSPVDRTVVEMWGGYATTTSSPAQSDPIISHVARGDRPGL